MEPLKLLHNFRKEEEQKGGNEDEEEETPTKLTGRIRHWFQTAKLSSNKD